VSCNDANEWFAVNGEGYWLATCNGAVFGFGSARDVGSLPALHVARRPVIGLATTPDGSWLLAGSCHGGVYAFGDITYKERPNALNNASQRRARPHLFAVLRLRLITAVGVPFGIWVRVLSI
jgi:hypothetical protein